MPSIDTKFLFHIELKVGGFHFIGNTPYGNRRVAFVDGGTFEGPKLKGIVHGGSDWLLVRGDGSTQLDVGLVLETDDNEKMCLNYPGMRVGEQDVLDRHFAGGPVDVSEYYFRTPMQFETGSEKYGWLNRILAIGIGYRSEIGPAYHVHQIL